MTIQEMAQLGGKASVKKRFKGKTKKQISELMRKVRLSKEEKKEVKEMAGLMVENLNKNVTNKTNLL